MSAATSSMLQTSVSDIPKNRSGSRQSNTETIRAMIKEQQKECQTLHHNPVFQEFRNKQSKAKKFGKGWVVDKETPTIDDIEAEAHQRLMTLIQQAATDSEKQPLGVWASFGKPYACLGDPIEPDSSLPFKLYREELEGAKSNGKMSVLKSASMPRNLASLAALPEPKPPTFDKAAAMASQQANALSGEDARVKASRAALRFAGMDKVEAQFPKGPLRQSNARVARSKAFNSSFVDPSEAEQHIADPTGSYGLPPVNPHLNKLTDIVPPTPEDSSHNVSSSTFLTQGGGTDMEGTVPSHLSSMAGMRAGNHSMGHASEDHSDTASHAEASSRPAAPLYVPMSDMAEPEPGNEGNPVYRWHNDFLMARQKGRENLQGMLHERSQQRCKARSTLPLAASLAGVVLGDLTRMRGWMPGYATQGAAPSNPYTRAEALISGNMERRRKAVALDPEELAIIQRFFDQLCALVEQQRVSDPLCLMTVHKVKSLLEGGVFLHRPLLAAVIAHIAEFVHGCGLLRHNPHLLPLITFLRKCVGVGEDELKAMLDEQEIRFVVYDQTEEYVLASRTSDMLMVETPKSFKARSIVGFNTGYPGDASEASSPLGGTRKRPALGTSTISEPLSLPSVPVFQAD